MIIIFLKEVMFMKSIKYLFLIVSMSFLSLQAAEQTFDSGSFVASIDPVSAGISSSTVAVLEQAAGMVSAAQEETAQAQAKISKLERQLAQLTLSASTTAGVIDVAQELEDEVAAKKTEIEQLKRSIRDLTRKMSAQSDLEAEFLRVQERNAQLEAALKEVQMQKKLAQKQQPQTTNTDLDDDQKALLVQGFESQIAALGAALLEQEASMHVLEDALRHDREEKARLALEAQLAKQAADRLLVAVEEAQQQVPEVQVVVQQQPLDLETQAALVRLAELEREATEMAIALKKLDEYRALVDEERRAQLPNPNPKLTEEQLAELREEMAGLHVVGPHSTAAASSASQIRVPQASSTQFPAASNDLVSQFTRR